MNKKTWIALGCFVVFLIATIFMVYFNPTGLIFGGFSFVAGGFAGYFLKSGVLQIKLDKKKALNENEV